MRAILFLYMAEQLGLGVANANTGLHLFIAACYFLPLAGGWLADNYFGKYGTIVGFSVPYILGHVILGVQSVPFLVVALSLLAMGSGVIKPNIPTLLGLTYDQRRPGQAQLRSDGFSIFYFSVNVGAVLSQLALPPIRTAYGYRVAFLFPAVLMAVAFLVFALGKPFYGKEPAARTRKTPEERAAQWAVLGRLLGLFVLVMFFWAIFDQHAGTWIAFGRLYMDLRLFGFDVDADQVQAFNPVFLLVLLPLTMVFWRVLARYGITVRPTDKMVAGFLLTAACMGVMALSALLVSGPVHQTVVLREGGRAPASATLVLKNGEEVPLTGAEQYDALKKEKDKDRQIRAVKLTLEDGEQVVVPSPVEKRVVTSDGEEVSEYYVRWVAPGDRVTVWWQVLAFLVITVAEIFISVTGLELAYTAAPRSMTGFVTACWLLTVGLANLFINAPVTRLYSRMSPSAYFGMLAGLLLLVTLGFVVVARRFNRRTP
jgi:dipeptide/tripeptide permease